MYKLRQTWQDIFPYKTLYDIDVKTKYIDPAWPITAKPPANPKTASSTQINNETNNIIPPLTDSSSSANDAPSVKSNSNQVIEEVNFFKLTKILC